MNLKKVHHIAIIGSNYEKSRRFYVDLLGFSVIRENYRPERDDYKIDLQLDGMELELFIIKNCPNHTPQPTPNTTPAPTPVPAAPTATPTPLLTIPKTGDNSSLGLLLAIAGISLAGLAVLVHKSARRKDIAPRDDDDEDTED